MMISMNDKELYGQILGVESPWAVTDVSLDMDIKEVVVKVEFPNKPHCPECDKICNIHDHKTRRWRHLDTCQFKTILEAKVPRSSCKIAWC